MRKYLNQEFAPIQRVKPLANQQQPKPRRSIAGIESISPSVEQDQVCSDQEQRPRGQKRRFGVAGILNVLITNCVLQALLASSTVSVTAATLISQATNTCFGYAIYGKMVFQANGLRHHRPLLRYLALMTVMWLLNAAGIEAGEILGINRNLAAAALVPCLAVVSFGAQKYWVFR